MLHTYHPSTQRQPASIDALDREALWYDLMNPTEDEIEAVEQTLHVNIPNQAEMREIEFSSRCYEEDDTAYMTINIVVSADSSTPESTPMTFIINNKRLITIRYSSPKSIEMFIKKAEKNHKNYSSRALFVDLLDIIISRLADITEMVGEKVDQTSQEIFDMKDRRKLKDYIVILGKEGDLSAKVRLSLENINRMLTFFAAHQGDLVMTNIKALKRDATSIAEHLSFVFQKINFLLDATLGLMHIEQNNVIKILSTAAVIFLPPTLIASIYGMNFLVMPELHYPIGYPIALFVILLSAILPYYYFKRKGWFQ